MSEWRALLGLPSHIVRRIVCLGREDTVVECGANVGKYTRIFSYSGARVIAFEPDPVAFRELKLNLGHLRNVVLIEAAVGIHNGNADLKFHQNRQDNPLEMSQGSSLLGDKPNVLGGESVQVNVIDLAEFARSQPEIAILKMDIEGFETVVVPRLLEEGTFNRVDRAFIELHHRKWPLLEDRTAVMLQAVGDAGLEQKVSFDWP